MVGAGRPRIFQPMKSATTMPAMAIARVVRLGAGRATGS
jgi:hypothetical protein